MLMFTKEGFINVLLKAFYIVIDLAVLFTVHARFGLSVPFNPLQVKVARFNVRFTYGGKVSLIAIPVSKFLGMKLK